MKIFSIQPPARRWFRAGFTLTEMMISTGIYLGIFVGVMVAIQIFALRVYTLAATKLTATQGAREALNQMRDDIRQGKGLLVGNSDNSGHFMAYSNSSAVGNALIIYSTTNFGWPPYTLYFLQTNTIGSVSSNNLIWMTVTSTTTNSSAIACYITNMDVFAAEGWDNWPTNLSTPPNPITNDVANNQVYSIKLQFYQWEYPIAVIGTNGYNAYDYFQLRTRVCRRALD